MNRPMATGRVDCARPAVAPVRPPTAPGVAAYGSPGSQGSGTGRSCLLQVSSTALPTPVNVRAHHPEHLVHPLVVSIPHASTTLAPWTDVFVPDLDPRCDADLHVDTLVGPLVTGALIVAQRSRFVCDLNRHPDEVTHTAVPAHPTPRAIGPRGFIWECTTRGQPTLVRPLSLCEWQMRRALHAEYHDHIAHALLRARARFGYAILLDAHSMPSRGTDTHADPGQLRAEIVPGDRHGQSCAPALRHLVCDIFSRSGLSIAPNQPYAGGFTVAHHGQPAQGVHAIQLEIRRDLYMDEALFLPIPERCARLQTVLVQLLRALETWRPEHALEPAEEI